MAGEDSPRAGAWMPPEPQAAPGSPEVAASGEPEREWWEDMPDPWDRPRQDEAATGEHLTLPGDNRHRSRFSRRELPLRRMAVVVILVGVVLLGSGALASMLTPEPTALPLPPPTAPEKAVTSSPDRVSGLDTAPSAGVTQSPTAGSPGTGSPGAVPGDGPTPSATEPGPAGGAQTAPGAGPAGGPPTTTATTTSFEAEDAQLGGLAHSYQTEQASGGEAVRMLGLWGVNHVQFPAVTVDSAGEYQLTFHYLSNRDRTGEFSVNDGERIAVEFPALESSQAVGSVDVTVELAEGENVIWFGGSGIAPDLDRITVTG